ncbi:Zinc finger MYM-type protein 1 [Merluccius polli]|uniref:Zinc finger MYM-type protein 1 n=1 Tax=Merluccius polli TaxID=89951 RepID=A0AA47N6F3_MERPO|nr:Zinc finger MYM-type protein 1 [Merluccius polli]
MSTAAKREKVLLDSAKGLVSDADLSTLQLSRIDIASLGLQLRMLGGLTKEQAFHSVKELAQFVSALHPQTRGLFSELEKLIHLCLCLPVSTACSERSFSALRRLKTWLRSTVTQRRLTHMALLHVHKDILDDLDLQVHIDDFISRTPERKSTFGVR